MARRLAVDYETISPYSFLKSLPEIARNTVPHELREYCKLTGFEAWNLLEEGVFYFFRHIFMLHTIKLGSDTLFKHEPEGIVLWDRCGGQNAFLYECKSRADGYVISSDDLLRYRDYIKLKKHYIKFKHHLPLTHFLIVSSEFKGDIELRLKEIDLEGVILSLISADCLKLLYEEAKALEFDGLHLLDLSRLFCRGQLCEADVSKAIANTV